jgi:hypothetical protein
LATLSEKNLDDLAAQITVDLIESGIEPLSLTALENLPMLQLGGVI